MPLFKIFDVDAISIICANRRRHERMGAARHLNRNGITFNTGRIFVGVTDDASANTAPL